MALKVMVVTLDLSTHTAYFNCAFNYIKMNYYICHFYLKNFYCNKHTTIY